MSKVSKLAFVHLIESGHCCRDNRSLAEEQDEVAARIWQETPWQ